MVSCEVNIRNEFFISVIFVENMITSYFSEKLRMGGIVNNDILEDDVRSINFDQKIVKLMFHFRLNIYSIEFYLFFVFVFICSAMKGTYISNLVHLSSVEYLD